MTPTQTMIEHAVLSMRDIENALYFRAHMGMRGFLEVPEPKVTFGRSEDGLNETVTFRREAPIWHLKMPTRTTHGGRATFFDLTDEATIAQVLAAKEGK